MDRVFEGSGLGALRTAYESVDWSATALGPPASWSPTLRSTVSLAMNTRFAVTLFWGPEFSMVYNEAYAQMIGDKHPAALGASARDVFPEIWDVIGPMMQNVFDGQGAVWAHDEQLFLDRRGFAEETYFTFSYSPVSDLHGTVEGVIDIAAETTSEVIVRRRLMLLGKLAEAMLDVDDIDAVVAAAISVLGGASDEVAAVTLTGPYLGPVSHPQSSGRMAAGRVIDGDPVPHHSVDGARRRALVDDVDGRQLARYRLDGSSLASRGAVLTVELSHSLAVNEQYLEFVRIAGASISQALDRVSAHQAERHAADLERQMAESLQRSLLSQPLKSDRVQIAVRYEAATEQAQVGGDWYDCFPLPDDALGLTIGDVVGHDRHAAAAMAQIRNVLRGVAFAGQGSPAAVLSDLDRAIRRFAIGTPATGILAQLERGGDESAGYPLRWSNAGHLPPVLIHPDGHAELLETDIDLMLGVNPQTARRDHVRMLQPESCVIFYTDGLIERRDRSIDESLRTLRSTLDSAPRQDTEDAELVCDFLLRRFGGAAEDDIALLVVRVLP